MDAGYRQIELDRQDDIFCVRLRKQRMAEEELHQLTEDLLGLIDVAGCRKMVLSLGPESPLCMYSIFLAKLVSIQRRLGQVGGVLKLAHVNPETYSIFEACNLQELFDFCPDTQAAVAELRRQ
jgi:hypothetical protein